MNDWHTFDVFLSYHSHDKTYVEVIARRLVDEEGLRLWLDRWNLIPGEPWQEDIERALKASRTCVVFLGARGIGPWENEEMYAALRLRVMRKGFRVIPVLLPNTSFPELSELPMFLSGLTWIDFRSGLDNPDEFQRLVAGIRGTSPGPGYHSTLNPPFIECPYRGMEVFEEAHARFFFGREAMTQHVIEALPYNQFMAILGTSGSGKSSLVRAGLIPQLKSGRLPHSENWTYVTLTPGAHPLNELALRLAGSGPHDDSPERAHTLLSRMESDDRALHQDVRLLLSEQSKDARLFLFIDQFEEIITLCADDKEREQFLLNLRYASQIKDGRLTILITMRADLMGRAAAQRNLAEMLSGHQFVLSPMDESDLRRAIEEPAALVGLRFEQGLVERILEEVGQAPGVLPLLEDALTQLYEKRNTANVATLQAYQEFGGVHGAIAKRAEAVFEEFSPEEQGIVRRVLLRLTQPGEGVEDTRRRIELDELWPDSAHRPAVERVVERLVVSRLLTMSNDLRGERTVDVAHEALIRGWPRLRRWIEEERSSLRIHRGLTESAHQWRDKNRDAAFLYRGVQLAEALEWKSRNASSINPLEKTFLEASQSAWKRENQAAQRRRWIAITGTLITLALGAFVLKYRQEQQAARLRELTNRSMQVRRLDPELGLRLAMEAEGISHTSEDVSSALRQALSSLQESIVLRGHSGIVWNAAFSPDKTHMVTASADNTARIWDVETGQQLVVLRGHDAEVWKAAFSPDGRRVVTASADNTARIWDVQTGQQLLTLRGHDAQVNSAVFNLDGTRVVTASDDNTARIWDAGKEQPPLVLRGHSGEVWDAAFSPDGAHVATVSADKTARIWNARTEQVPLVLRGHNDQVTRMAYSPDSNEIVTGSLDHTARVWDAHTGKLLSELNGHSDSITSVNYSQDGKYLVTASEDSMAQIWEAHTGKLLSVLRGHSGTIHSAAFNPDGGQVVTAGADKTVRLWDAYTGRPLSELRGHSDEVWEALFSPNGMQVVSVSADMTGRIWEAHMGQAVRELRGHDAQVNSVDYSRDGKYIVTASADNTARIWDVETGQQLVVLRGHDAEVWKAAFSPDGRRVVTASADNTARIWDVQTGQQLLTLRGHNGAVRKADFSPDGRRVVTASADNTARIWDVETGQQLLTLRGHSNILRGAVFSPDGTHVVTVSLDNTARIWDAGKEQPPLVLRGHSGEVWDAAFSPDGKHVVTASVDKTARVWDARTGQPLYELKGHTAGIESAAFSSDGKRVLTASRDRTVRLWDLHTEQPFFEFLGHKGVVRSAAFSPDEKHVVTAGADKTIRIYACEMCGTMEELVTLAHTRNPRQLTLEERRMYLHER